MKLTLRICGEVLALTKTHLIHVMMPVPSSRPGDWGAAGKAEVLRSPLLYITNVRSTSTGGLMIELGDGGTAFTFFFLLCDGSTTFTFFFCWVMGFYFLTQVLYRVSLHSKYPRALIFQNFFLCQGLGSR